MKNSGLSPQRQNGGCCDVRCVSEELHTPVCDNHYYYIMRRNHRRIGLIVFIVAFVVGVLFVAVLKFREGFQITDPTKLKTDCNDSDNCSISYAVSLDDYIKSKCGVQPTIANNQYNICKKRHTTLFYAMKNSNEIPSVKMKCSIN